MPPKRDFDLTVGAPTLRDRVRDLRTGFRDYWSPTMESQSVVSPTCASSTRSASQAAHERPERDQPIARLAMSFRWLGPAGLMEAAFFGYVAMFMASTPRRGLAILAAALGGLIAVVIVGLLRSRASLFADRLEYRNGYRATRTVPIEQIESAVIERRGWPQSNSIGIYITTGGREIPLHASRFSNEQRDLFSRGLTEAVSAARSRHH
jgi:hypothetical protein